jgi:UDP-glucuronate 4-epimerase
MSILVTGAAGFVGYHLTQRLLGQGQHVVGVDNLNSSYDPALKRARLARLSAHPRFRFERLDLADRAQAESLFGGGGVATPFTTVVHMAAQDGLRASITHPHAVVDSNLTAFLHVLEGCRKGASRLIYASSSASTSSRNFVAASKRANESMAESYAHLFGIAATGVRLFTVYGPWGRPDMAAFRFAEAMERGGTIELRNYGRMEREFTYVADVVEGVVRVIERPQDGHRLYEIGSGKPVALLDFVRTMEAAYGRRAPRRFVPMQPGEVPTMRAESRDFVAYSGFRPATSLNDGVEQFVHWYRSYYGRAARARVA